MKERLLEHSIHALSCPEPRYRDMPLILKDLANNAGVPLTESALAKLGRTLGGGDLDRAQNELAKIALIFPESNQKQLWLDFVGSDVSRFFDSFWLDLANSFKNSRNVS